MSQEPTYSISSLEGQLRLCQEKLAQVLSHHEQVIAAELHLRYKWSVGASNFAMVHGP